MPEIAVAASSAATANVTPAATGNSSAAAADSQATGPFAAVLQRQMESPADNQPPAAIDAAAIAAAATDPVPAAGNLAALLPMLMGSTVMAGDTAAVPATQGTKKAASDDGNTSGTTSATVLALPAFAAANVATPAETAAGTASTQTAGSSAVATANLAATPDLATGSAKPDAKSDDSFAALLPDNRDVRAAGQPANAIHAAPVANAASGATSHTVDTPVGGQGWDTEVGNRLVWLSNNHSSRAELTLTPPQLGKIEISLTMSGDKATASFVSASPVVREAIESAMPRLREVLANAGVTLGQTQVGSEAPKQWANDGQNRDNSSRGSAAVTLGGSGMRVSTTGMTAWTGTGRGLVDVFA